MEDKSQVWKDYKSAVLERVADYAWLFGNLRKQHPSGDGWVAACCPFHDDKNPSFAFNVKTGRWACFSKCGKGGPLDFVMHTTGVSFKEALFSLGDKVGVGRPSLNGEKANGSGQGISETLVQELVQTLAQSPKILEFLHKKRGLTDETIQKYQLGWDDACKRIAIPIRDENGRLVNIRLYSPSQKAKIINTKGCGSPPRLYGADDLAKCESKQVILCEGEFDRLILQQNGFVAVTSTHGCTTFRPEWLPLLEGKDVIIGYDVDEEGQAAVEAVVLRAFKGAKAASVKNLKLPLAGTKDDKDFTDFFTKPRSPGGDLFEKRCFTRQDLESLIAAAPAVDLAAFAPGKGSGPSGRSPDLLAIINSLRNAEDLKAHERHVAVAETVAGNLAGRGAFFFDPKSTDELLCLDGDVFPIGNNRPFNALLQNIGRFSFTNPEGRFVWEYLRNHARIEGAPVRSSSWVYGDPFLPVLYVHAHNDDGQILKIAPGSITLLTNGHNPDKILLNPSDRVQPFKYLPETDIAEGLKLLWRLIDTGSPCADADKAFLMAFLPVIFLRDFCPTKPLIRVSGIHGSGKTSLVAMLSQLVYGENVGKFSTSSANYTDASKNPLTILDNKEAKDLDRDLLNFLLTASTGIVHEKRKLYENQEIIRERANAFIISNGIETLGKPELLSRQWEIACDSSFFKGDFSETENLRQLSAHRDVVLSAILKLIALHVLPNLAHRKTIEMGMNARFGDHPKRRTFSCLSLILQVWGDMVRIVNLPGDLDEKWLEAQRTVSEETSRETNIFIQFLTLLGASSFTYKQLGLVPRESGDRRGFEASSVVLLNVFSRLARENGMTPPFVNAKQLGERLREAIPVLQGAGWQAEMRARKNGDGMWFHRFFEPGNANEND